MSRYGDEQYLRRKAEMKEALGSFAAPICSAVEKRERLRAEGWINEQHGIWISPDRSLIQIVFDDGSVWEGQRLCR